MLDVIGTVREFARDRGRLEDRGDDDRATLGC